MYVSYEGLKSKPLGLIKTKTLEQYLIYSCSILSLALQVSSWWKQLSLEKLLNKSVRLVQPSRLIDNIIAPFQTLFAREPMTT